MAYCVPIGLDHEEFLSWSEESQDKAMAFLRLRDETCECGTRLEEWEDDRFAYVAHSWQCPGCEVLELEEDNIREDAKGVHKRLIPNPTR